MKNQKEINLDEYRGETHFKKIFVFSGVWDDKKAEGLQKQYQDIENLEIISPSTLYHTLKNSQLFVNNFYSYEELYPQADDLNLNDYRLVGNGSRFTGKQKECRIYDDIVCFEKTGNLFYSPEYGALIQKDDIGKGESTRLFIEGIMTDINR